MSPSDRLPADPRSPAAPATITCPTCGRTSAHPRDVETGYCRHCHDWTSERADRRR